MVTHTSDNYSDLGGNEYVVGTGGILAVQVGGTIATAGGTAINGNGLIYESALDTIAAHPGGGQANATPLVNEVNRITVVATPGDSVMLPASAPGLTIFVINGSTNPMQVFGGSTDTIDGVATATGVAQMQGSSCIYSCTTAGAWYTNGIGTGYSGSLPTVSSTNGIAAHPGGGQGAATPLVSVLNRVTTVASSGDSTLLPASAPGLQITVINAAGTSMNVFPATGDAINALSANAAFALAASKVATFYCTIAGQWHSILSA